MKNITIAGNVTKDAAMRTTNNGHKVASFSIAVNGYENGEKTSTFFDVSLWGKRGEQVMQFASAWKCISPSHWAGSAQHSTASLKDLSLELSSVSYQSTQSSSLYCMYWS